MDEVGAHGAGRTYDIEPVAVKNGLFYPNCLRFLSDEEAGLVIGRAISLSGAGVQTLSALNISIRVLLQMLSATLPDS